MVFFACNNCGTSLKKNQVDKHVFQCRCSTVSCMDCQKDFSVQEYGTHIKCISEEEKYAATGWKAPANFNKGEKKQQAWIDTVNATLKQGGSTLTPACKSLLQAMSKHDNVPRKKPKFLNFISNVAKGRFDEKTINTVWTLVEEQWKAQASEGKATSNGNGEAEKENEKLEDSKIKNGISIPEVQEEEATAENGKLSKRDKKEARRQKQNKEEKKEWKKKNSTSQEDVDEDGGKTNDLNDEERGIERKLSKKEMKKRKRVESASELEKKKTKENDEIENGAAEDEPNDEENQDGEDLDQGCTRDFKWGTIIRDILLSSKDHTISMKKLTRKVVSEYYAVVGDSKGHKTKPELISKLNKKLKKQSFKVFKDEVRLVE